MSRDRLSLAPSTLILLLFSFKLEPPLSNAKLLPLLSSIQFKLSKIGALEVEEAHLETT